MFKKQFIHNSYQLRSNLKQQKKRIYTENFLTVKFKTTVGSVIEKKR